MHSSDLLGPKSEAPKPAGKAKCTISYVGIKMDQVPKRLQLVVDLIDQVPMRTRCVLLLLTRQEPSRNWSWIKSVVSDSKQKRVHWDEF